MSIAFMSEKFSIEELESCATVIDGINAGRSDSQTLWALTTEIREVIAGRKMRDLAERLAKACPERFKFFAGRDWSVHDDSGHDSRALSPNSPQEYTLWGFWGYMYGDIVAETGVNPRLQKLAEVAEFVIAHFESKGEPNV